MHINTSSENCRRTHCIIRNTRHVRYQPTPLYTTEQRGGRGGQGSLGTSSRVVFLRCWPARWLDTSNRSSSAARRPQGRIARSRSIIRLAGRRPGGRSWPLSGSVQVSSPRFPGTTRDPTTTQLAVRKQASLKGHRRWVLVLPPPAAENRNQRFHTPRSQPRIRERGAGVWGGGGLESKYVSLFRKFRGGGENV